MSQLAYLQPRQLDRAMKAGEVVVLDVRRRKDFQNEHIPNSINIPYKELADNIHMLPVDKKLVLVCRDGHIARQAAYLVIELGHEPLILDGGIICFRSAQRRLRSTVASRKNEITFKIILAMGGLTSAAMLATGIGAAPAVLAALLINQVARDIDGHKKDQ